MILIDTNVLLRAAQPSHTHFVSAKAAVKTARLRGYIPSVVPQVIYEYWVVATRSIAENGLGMTVAEAAGDVAKIMEQFHLFRDERAIFDRWQQLVVNHHVQGKRAHDTRLVAAMERHSVKYLLTFNNQHFQHFPSIKVVHPDEATSLQVV
jgi:predicted nucleic acid-binding protein